MPFAWTPDLSVGIDRIDDQHRELMARAEALRRLLAEGERAGPAGPAAFELLRYLADYVVDHFGEEERFMEAVAFPGRVAHAAEHARLIETLGGLVRTFARSGVGPTLSVEVEREVCAWIRAHILSTDQVLGRFATSAVPA